MENNKKCIQCKNPIITKPESLLDHKYKSESLLYDKEIRIRVISDYLSHTNSDCNLCLLCYYENNYEDDYQAMPPPKPKKRN